MSPAPTTALTAMATPSIPSTIGLTAALNFSAVSA